MTSREQARGRLAEPVATHAIYATIIVNGHYRIGRATPPHRQNQLDVAYFIQTPVSETRDYTVAQRLCQAHARDPRS